MVENLDIKVDDYFQKVEELKNNGYKVKISEPDSDLEKNIKNFKPT